MSPRKNALGLLHPLRLALCEPLSLLPGPPASRMIRRNFTQTHANRAIFQKLKKAAGVVHDHLNEFDMYRKYVLAVKNPGAFVDTSVDIFKNEWKLIKQDVKDSFNRENLLPDMSKRGQIDMLCTFDEEGSTEKFVVSTDRTNSGGYSFATLTTTQSGTGLFSGYLDTRVPKDGLLEYAGYATMLRKPVYKSFGRIAKYHWDSYTHLVLKVRGDGRSYMIILSVPGSFSEYAYDQYQAPLYTRGGPYWQITKIPYSDFVYTSCGRVQRKQEVMDLNSCTRYGITLSDNKDGPFKLEIDYIGLENVEGFNLICPYESYHLPETPQI